MYKRQTLTLPDNSEFEEIHIAGEVDPFVGDNNTVNLTVNLDATVDNASIPATLPSFIAPEGTAVPFQVLIVPSANFRLSAASFTARTLPAYVSSSGFSQLGDSVLWSGIVTIPATSTSTATITLNGDDPTNILNISNTSSCLLYTSPSPRD